MKKYLYIVLALLLFGACQKFLDKDPTNEQPDQTAYQKYSDITVGLNGCYKGMLAIGYYGKNFVIYPEVASDNMKINLNRQTGRFQSVYYYVLGSGSAEPKDLWNAGYDVINRANRIIKALPNIKDGTEEDRNSALAEALAIRAMSHFDMLRAFAQPYINASGENDGIPIITENTDNATPARNKVSEVYTQILTDLDQASVLMSKARSFPFTFTSTSIKALKARVLLYKGDWTNAAKEASAIANPGNLLVNTQYVSGWSMDYSKEDLLVLGFSKFDYLTTEAIGYSFLEEGYGDIIATNDIFSLYDTSDVRRSFISASGSTNYCTKYPGRESTIGYDNIRVIRMAEMYLTAAEAYAELNDVVNANKYLNDLRSKRYNNAATLNLSGDDLKKEIQKERRRELAFEGHRLFDLTRRGQGVSRIDVNPGAVSTVSYPNDKLIMPIPQRELDANKNMKQNPGY